MSKEQQMSLQGKDQSDSEGSSPLTVTSRVCMLLSILFLIGFFHSLYFVDYFRFCVCWETSLLDRLLCSHNGFNQFGNELPIIDLLDSLALLPLFLFGWFHPSIFSIHLLKMYFKLFIVLDNLPRMQKLISFPSKLKLVCGIGLVKLKCWTLNQVHFLGTCSLPFTTLSTPSAMNILRMKSIDLLRFVVFLCSLYSLLPRIL